MITRNVKQLVSFCLRTLCTVVAYCSVSLCFSQSLLAEGNWQGWNSLTGELLEKDNFTLSGYSGFRFREGFDEFWYFETALKATQKISPRFSISSSVSLLRLQLFSDVMTTEYRPSLQFNWSEQISAWSFNARLRNEYRVQSADQSLISQREGFRFRLRAKMGHMLGGNYGVFVSEEILYGELSSSFEQNRVFTGVTFPKLNGVTPSISLGLFSLREGSSFKNTPVLSIDFHT